jgi:hypothetical protein
LNRQDARDAKNHAKKDELIDDKRDILVTGTIGNHFNHLYEGILVRYLASARRAWRLGGSKTDRL